MAFLTIRGKLNSVNWIALASLVQFGWNRSIYPRIVKKAIFIWCKKYLSSANLYFYKDQFMYRGRQIWDFLQFLEIRVLYPFHSRSWYLGTSSELSKFLSKRGAGKSVSCEQEFKSQVLPQQISRVTTGGTVLSNCQKNLNTLLNDYSKILIGIFMQVDMVTSEGGNSSRWLLEIHFPRFLEISQKLLRFSGTFSVSKISEISRGSENLGRSQRII